MNLKITNKGMYWGLIGTFTLLYLLVAFVSTLHAIDFFELSNNLSLAILLGVAYEVGQASVLFSILMTKNKEKFLPWLLMILLTALQVTANVYASFKHMSVTGNDDWTYWYTSILKIFGVTGGTTESYQVIISWISGALLPIVALGMTALVANNIKLITEGDDPVIDESEKEVDVKYNSSEENKEGYYEKEIPIEDQTKDDDDLSKIVDRIKDLIKKDPKDSGAISDELKSKIAPGIEREEYLDDTEKTTVEETKKVNNDIKVDVTPSEEDESPLPSLSPEDTELFGDDDLPFPEEATEKVVYEGPIKEEPKVEGEIKSNNGLVELTTPNSDSTEHPPPIPEPPQETEEERLERLRRIAREKLKKK